MIDAFETGKSLTVADDVGETHAAIESMRRASLGLDGVAIDAGSERPSGFAREEIAGEPAMPVAARDADRGMSEVLAALGAVERPAADMVSRPTDGSPASPVFTPMDPAADSNVPFEPFGVPSAMAREMLSDHVPAAVMAPTDWRDDAPGRGVATANMVADGARSGAGRLGAMLAGVMPSVGVTAVGASIGGAGSAGPVTHGWYDSAPGVVGSASQDPLAPGVVTSPPNDAVSIAQATQGRNFSVADFGRDSGFAAVAAGAPGATSPVIGDELGLMAAIGGPIGAGLAGSIPQPSASGAVLPNTDAGWGAPLPPEDGRRTDAERSGGIVPPGEMGHGRAPGPAGAATAAQATAEAAQQAPIVVHTEVHLDGSVLARAVTDRIVAGMNGPLAGTGAFDPRRSYTPIEG